MPMATARTEPPPPTARAARRRRGIAALAKSSEGFVCTAAPLSRPSRRAPQLNCSTKCRSNASLTVLLSTAATLQSLSPRNSKCSAPSCYLLVIGNSLHQSVLSIHLPANPLTLKILPDLPHVFGFMLPPPIPVQANTLFADFSSLSFAGISTTERTMCSATNHSRSPLLGMMRFVNLSRSVGHLQCHLYCLQACPPSVHQNVTKLVQLLVFLWFYLLKQSPLKH